MNQLIDKYLFDIDLISGDVHIQDAEELELLFKGNLGQFWHLRRDVETAIWLGVDDRVAIVKRLDELNRRYIREGRDLPPMISPLAFRISFAVVIASGMFGLALAIALMWMFGRR